MIKPSTPSRRRFLLGGMSVVGALIVGWGVLPPRQRLNAGHPLTLMEGDLALNGWVSIDQDGNVIVALHRSEMGQGIHTALQMLVAEELDVPLSKVKTVYAPIDRIYGNLVAVTDALPFRPDDDGAFRKTADWIVSKVARELGVQLTGGSTSVRDAWLPMREAAASARSMLVSAAAHEWKVAANECAIVDGEITHPSGRRSHFGHFAAKALQFTPTKIQLKSPQQFTLIGTPQSRTDVHDKVNGRAEFGIDARIDSMVFAVLQMCPIIGGAIKQFNATKALHQAGVMKVLTIPAEHGGVAGVAVIAKSYWQAKQALPHLQIEWDEGVGANLSTESLFADLQKQLDVESGYTFFQQGDPKPEFEKTSPKWQVRAEYRAPLLAHATMEPINCTAQWQNGHVYLWTSTQAPSLAVDAAASLAGVSRDDVHLKMSYLGGGFGRRLEVDMVKQAVFLAMQLDGLPVKLVWTREDDVTHDLYRPAAIARFAASLNEGGDVTSFAVKSVSGSVIHQILKRTFGLPAVTPHKSSVEGEFDLPYEFPHQQVTHVTAQSPVPLGYWRSVGHSYNAFFTESFIDELAHAAGKDGLDFRRQLLRHHPRHLAVLDAVAQAAPTAQPGRALGLAMHQSFGSIVAQIAEVSVVEGQIRVHRVTCAMDCGLVVNPKIVEQQMESGIIFGLSAALYGEITIKAGRIQQSNFHDYPVLRMHETPEISVVLIKSAEIPAGVGEPGVPPIAPAVANALFALKGVRLRQLPLKWS